MLNTIGFLKRPIAASFQSDGGQQGIHLFKQLINMTNTWICVLFEGSVSLFTAKTYLEEEKIWNSD